MVSINETETRIPALITYELHDYYDMIKFSNAIMVDKARNKGEKCLHYKLELWNNVGTFDILNKISDHVKLF